LSDPYYPEFDDVVRIHDEAMSGTGSQPSPLVRPDLLESAINRPRQLAYYEPGVDLISQAVRLAVGISQAQAFRDGNKRTALATADTFLAVNGQTFRGDPITFACWLICVAGNISNDDLDVCADHLGFDLVAKLDVIERREVEAQFEGWLRQNVAPTFPVDFY
jgi:death on curing protein